MIAPGSSLAIDQPLVELVLVPFEFRVGKPPNSEILGGPASRPTMFEQGRSLPGGRRRCGVAQRALLFEKRGPSAGFAAGKGICAEAAPTIDTRCKMLVHDQCRTSLSHGYFRWSRIELRSSRTSGGIAGCFMVNKRRRVGLPHIRTVRGQGFAKLP